MRPPRGRSHGECKTERLAGEGIRGGLGKTRLTNVGPRSGFAVGCQCLPCGTSLHILSERATERHLGCRPPGAYGKIEPNSAEAARASGLLGRSPRAHI